MPTTRTRARARRALLLAAVAAALPGCAARLPAQQPPRAERESALLAPARIAALPAAERQAWERYLGVSRSRAQADRDALAAELRAAGLEKATPAPRGDGFGIESRMTAEWFRGEE